MHSLADLPEVEVEAAGFEPASRGISMRASTCVVDSLAFAVAGPNRHGTAATSQKRFLTATVSGVSRGDLELATDFWVSPAKTRSQGYRLLGSQSEVALGTYSVVSF